MLQNSLYQNYFSFLVFNIIISLLENFKKLCQELSNYADNIIEYENKYFLIKYNFIKDKEIAIFFENNKDFVEFCEIFGKILFQNPIIIYLFIIIKIWANNKNICMNSSGIRNKKVFDDPLILYFIFLFLMQTGEITTFNDYVSFDENKKIKINKINKN